MHVPNDPTIHVLSQRANNAREVLRGKLKAQRPARATAVTLNEDNARGTTVRNCCCTHVPRPHDNAAARAPLKDAFGLWWDWAGPL